MISVKSGFLNAAYLSGRGLGVDMAIGSEVVFGVAS